MTQVMNDHNSIICLRLPSEVRQVSQVTWTLTSLVGLDITELERFTVDPYQDLLATVIEETIE